MAARTDIASESEYILNGTDLSGIERRTERCEDALIETDFIKIITDEAAQKIGRPKGRYITFTLGGTGIEGDTALLTKRAAVISAQIKCLLPGDLSGGVLFAGLGNRRVTPDSVGPLAADRVFATRHLKKDFLKGITLNRTSVISPGVMAQTGLESAALIRLIAGRISPSAIIVCDAFACCDIEHLGSVISVCDTGISPGSGVNNSRAEISGSTMPAPCIAIGIPTVADIGAVTDSDDKALSGLIVTPSDIDTVVGHGSALISLSVNLAIQPELSPEEILSLMT